MAHYRKTWRHPKNRKYITYRKDAGAGPSHGHRQHAQKFSKDRAYPRGQTHTHIRRHTHHNTSHLLWGRSKMTYTGHSSHKSNMFSKNSSIFVTFYILTPFILPTSRGKTKLLIYTKLLQSFFSMAYVSLATFTCTAG